MMRKIFIVLALCGVIYSCSKDDKAVEKNDEEITTEIPVGEITIVTETIDKYSFNRARFDDNIVKVALSGGDMLFYGNKDGKLSLAVYDTISKKEVFNWTNDKVLPEKLQVNQGYGETKEYDIKDYLIRGFVCENSKCAFVLQGVADGNFLLTSGLYFVGENLNKNYSYSFDVTEDNITKWWDWEEISYWENNRCIVAFHEAIDMKSGKYVHPVICYSLNGEEQFIVKAEKYGEQVSMTDALNYTVSSVERVNIETGVVLWTNEFNSLEGLESDVRVDATNVVSKDATKIVYRLKYTLISGEKGSRDIEIDLTTGNAKIL